MDQQMTVAFPLSLMALLGAGVAHMIQAPRLARSLVSVAIGTVAMPLVLSTLDPATRMAIIFGSIPVMVLLYARKILGVIIGKEATGVVIGTWVVRLFDLVFRIPGAIARRFFRNPPV